jgi:hypothetical protein
MVRGTTLACSGEVVMLAFGRPLRGKTRPQRSVNAKRMWDVGKAANAKVGALGACHFGKELWFPCRVTGAENGRFRVESDEGQVREIEATDLVPLEGEPRAILFEHFASRDRRRGFDQAVLAARMPVHAHAVGDAVLAPRISSIYFDATIVVIEGEEAVVRWAGQPRWPDRRVALARLGVKGGELEALKLKQLVLFRHESDPTRWEAARVKRPAVDGQVAVVDANGRSLERPVDAIVPFAPSE